MHVLDLRARSAKHIAHKWQLQGLEDDTKQESQLYVWKVLVTVLSYLTRMRQGAIAAILALVTSSDTKMARCPCSYLGAGDVLRHAGEARQLWHPVCGGPGGLVRADPALPACQGQRPEARACADPLLAGRRVQHR